MVRLPLPPPAETVARLSSARDHPANGEPGRPKCGERVESAVAVSASGVGAGNEYVGAQGKLFLFASRTDPVLERRVTGGNDASRKVVAY